MSVIYARLAVRLRYILDRNWKIKPPINKRVISGVSAGIDCIYNTHIIYIYKRADRPDMENDIPIYDYTHIYCKYIRINLYIYIDIYIRYTVSVYSGGQILRPFEQPRMVFFGRGLASRQRGGVTRG